MLKRLFLFSIILCVFPVVDAHAAGDVDLVLQNISLDPLFPKDGQLTAITAEVYNAGIKDIHSLNSIVTVGYFIDGHLIHVGTLDNVLPGIKNKIQISSPPLWVSESGMHNVDVILDYHNTLLDELDSPENNSISKTISVSTPITPEIFLDASSKYFIQGEYAPQITLLLINSETKEPMPNQEIILNFDDKFTSLITNAEGKTSFSNTVSLFESLNISATFVGDEQHLQTNSSITLFPLPHTESSYLILDLIDPKKEFNFKDYPIEILIFQDSYQNLLKKIIPDQETLLDEDTFWISLPSGHYYFSEIYLDGKLFFATESRLLDENSVLTKQLKIPELGQIKFKIVDENKKLIPNTIVKNWIYSLSTENGISDWEYVLPSNDTPYVAEVFSEGSKIGQSLPFSVFSGERKTIEIKIIDDLSYKIPVWIKNNAGWWAEGSIDDNSFIQGIQFLIKEGLLKIPPTLNSSSGETDEIPVWIKNNAGWWAEGSIDDNSFIQGIQFLIQEEIIQIS